jgi:urea transport system ATP-binding protein
MSAPPLDRSEARPADGNGLSAGRVAAAADETDRASTAVQPESTGGLEATSLVGVTGTSSEPPPQPHATADPGPIGLWVEELTVSFDGFKAIDDVTLLLNRGELRCIIGPNGAGKTTLMDCITGKTKPNKGQVFLESRLHDLTELSECQIAELGVCRKFQRPTVFPQHTVYENCELALKVKGGRGVFRTLFASLNRADRERIDEVLEIIGLQDRKDTKAGLLAHGHKQWLEIGMLLAMDPKVLLIDEPVAGMTQPEMERTAELMKKLAGERTVVVVEHDMEFVRSIARKVTVLHEGRILAEGDMADIQRNPRVIEVYLGT